MEKNTNYKTRLHLINTFILDVDGVLTNGKVLLESSGEMTRTMSTRDGFIIQHALKRGYNVCVITLGNSEMVRNRMNYLGVKDVFMTVENKLEVLNQYCSEKGINHENVLYVGDDIPDMECIKKSGIGTCPNDAVQEIRGIADYISHINGGDGCVREIMEQVLKSRNDWF